MKDTTTVIPRNSLIEANQSGLIAEPLIDITPQPPMPDYKGGWMGGWAGLSCCGGVGVAVSGAADWHHTASVRARLQWWAGGWSMPQPTRCRLLGAGLCRWSLHLPPLSGALLTPPRSPAMCSQPAGRGL